MKKHGIPIMLKNCNYLVELTASEVVLLRQMILDAGTAKPENPRPGSFLASMFEKLIPPYQHSLSRQQKQRKRQRLIKRKVNAEVAALEKMLDGPAEEARS